MVQQDTAFSENDGFTVGPILNLSMVLLRYGSTLANNGMKLLRVLVIVQVVAALFIAPVSSAANEVACDALQERFNRLYIRGFRHFDRLMDGCENSTSADSPERESCIKQAGKTASGRISVPMNELKKEWRSNGCPGRPSEPDL